MEQAVHGPGFTCVVLRSFTVLLLLLAGLASAGAVRAQAVHSYASGQNARLDGGTSCFAPLVRNFNVAESFTVGDVDIGIYATHASRGELRMTLQAPDGTRRQLVDGSPAAITGNNFNVLLDDEGTQLVNTDSPTGNHPTSNPPPFAHDFRPDASLDVFDGKSSNGIWRLEICDLDIFSDNGQFRHAELYLTEMPANAADLSLAMTVSNSGPASGQTVIYTLTLTNSASSSLTASGVAVAGFLAAGVDFVGAAGDGIYDAATGVWTVASLAPGEAQAIALTATVTATSGATLVSSAEIVTSSAPDSDSFPANGAPNEDDYAAVSLTVTGVRSAGIPPALSCPRGVLLFDWDLQAWLAGLTANVLALSGYGDIGFALTSGLNWVSSAAYGGQSPTRSNAMQSGLPTAEYGLTEYIDFADRAEIAQTVISLPAAVPGVQFTVFDVDYYGGQFADRLKVYGSYNGATVVPVLTNGLANYVIGNEAFGDVLAANADPDGNVVVTFEDPVDTITIEYGNHALAPANPGGQAITIHDLLLCAPDATLSVLKISSILSDPVNGTDNPAAIPGALLSYCILVGNAGSATASNILASDALPAGIAYSPGSMRSGGDCSSAAMDEDDNANGADEANPVGASVSGNSLSITATSLGPGEQFALVFEAVVQ